MATIPILLTALLLCSSVSLGLQATSSANNALAECGKYHRLDATKFKYTGGTGYTNQGCSLQCVFDGVLFSSNAINEQQACPTNPIRICHNGTCTMKQTTQQPTTSPPASSPKPQHFPKPVDPRAFNIDSVEITHVNTTLKLENFQNSKIRACHFWSKEFCNSSDFNMGSYYIKLTEPQPFYKLDYKDRKLGIIDHNYAETRPEIVSLKIALQKGDKEWASNYRSLYGEFRDHFPVLSYHPGMNEYEYERIVVLRALRYGDLLVPIGNITQKIKYHFSPLPPVMKYAQVFPLVNFRSFNINRLEITILNATDPGHTWKNNITVNVCYSYNDKSICNHTASAIRQPNDAVMWNETVVLTEPQSLYPDKKTLIELVVLDVELIEGRSSSFESFALYDLFREKFSMDCTDQPITEYEYEYKANDMKNLHMKFKFHFNPLYPLKNPTMCKKHDTA